MCVCVYALTDEIAYIPLCRVSLEVSVKNKRNPRHSARRGVVSIIYSVRRGGAQRSVFSTVPQ